MIVRALVSLAVAVAAFAAHADEITAVEKDGFMPLNIDSRVTFYAVKTYTSGKRFPEGTEALMLVISECKLNKSKYVVTEVMVPGNGAYKVFPNDTELAHTLQSKPFGEHEDELRKLIANMCETHYKAV